MRIPTHSRIHFAVTSFRDATFVTRHDRRHSPRNSQQIIVKSAHFTERSRLAPLAMYLPSTARNMNKLYSARDRSQHARCFFALLLCIIQQSYRRGKRAKLQIIYTVAFLNGRTMIEKLEGDCGIAILVRFLHIWNVWRHVCGAFHYLG